MDRIHTSIRLRQIMEERGIKQADLVRMCAPFAREAGISMGKSAISQYVTGKSLPAQRQLTILGQALNVSEAWLMGFDVPRGRAPAKAESDPEPFPLTPHEKRLVTAYRNNPPMQPAVNRLLGIPDESADQPRNDPAADIIETLRELEKEGAVRK